MFGIGWESLRVGLQQRQGKDFELTTVNLAYMCPLSIEDQRMALRIST